MKLDEKLRMKRSELNMTQKTFAKYLGVPYSTYFQYELGWSVGPKYLVKILTKLNLTVDDLIDKGETNESTKHQNHGKTRTSQSKD